MAADFYSELGVEKGADAEEIKKAYRKLAAKLHPDRHPGDKKIESRFKSVNRAYQVLSDPKLRKLYDEFGGRGPARGLQSERRACLSAREPRRRRSRPRRAGLLPRRHLERGRQRRRSWGFVRRHVRARRGRARQARGSDVAAEVTVDFASAIRGASLSLRVQEGGEDVTVRVPPGAGDGDKVRGRRPRLARPGWQAW
jgi:curved DNA-binding protein